MRSAVKFCAAFVVIGIAAIAWQKTRQARLNEELLAALDPSEARPRLALYSPEYYRWLARAGARIEPLLRRGADPNARSDDTFGMVRRWGWLVRILHQHVRIHAGAPALIESMWNREPSAVRTLLKYGADPNGRSSNGKSALAVAMFDTTNYGGVAKDLVEQGAHDFAASPMRGMPGGHPSWIRTRTMACATVLDWALVMKDDALVTVLLRHGADPNQRDLAGQTPLMWAVYAGRAEEIPVLFAAGASPEIRSQDGLTAMDHAVKLHNRAGAAALTNEIEQRSIQSDAQHEHATRPKP